MLYGPHFAPAAESFSILAWMLPIAMLSGHHRYILLAYGHQRRLLRCTGISAAVAVLLGFTFVPWFFRGDGAAWALLSANLVNFILVMTQCGNLSLKSRFGGGSPAPLLTLPLLSRCLRATRQKNESVGRCGGCIWRLRFHAGVARRPASAERS